MSKRKITITVSDDLYDKLEKMAEAMCLTKNSLCTYVIANHVYVSNKMLTNNIVNLSNNDLDNKD